jgi:hypothetical protein
MTYEVGGKQYVAIAAGTEIYAFGLFEPVAKWMRRTRLRGSRSRDAKASADSV